MRRIQTPPSGDNLFLKTESLPINNQWIAFFLSNPPSRLLELLN